MIEIYPDEKGDMGMPCEVCRHADDKSKCSIGKKTVIMLRAFGMPSDVCKCRFGETKEEEA